MVEIFSLVAHKVFTFFSSGAKNILPDDVLPWESGRDFPRLDAILSPSFIVFPFFCSLVDLMTLTKLGVDCWLLRIWFKTACNDVTIVPSPNQTDSSLPWLANGVEDFSLADFARRLSGVHFKGNLFFIGDTHGYVRKMFFRSLSP